MGFVRQEHCPRILDGGFCGGEEVVVRVEAAEFGALDEAVENRRDLGTALGFGSVMIFTTDDGTTEAAFDLICVQWYSWVVEEFCQAVPVSEQIFVKPRPAPS